MAKPQVFLHQPGLVDYKQAWDWQQSLFDKALALKAANRNLPPEQQQLPANHLIMLQHPHVYTLGKSGDAKNLLLTPQELEAEGIQYYPINRGGDITYHGPEQVVGYPILDLDQFFTDIHRYMRSLEEVVIRMLGDYGIEAGRYPGYTGVWLDGENDAKARKICALGVKCSRWVTMHGWALNVNSDLSFFKNIVPCGIEDKAVTSMHTELGRRLPLAEVQQKIARHFEDVFECRLQVAEAVAQP